MKRDEAKVKEAERLKARGLSNRAIGERLGVTHSAVSKWLNPERNREYNRRDAARPERKVAKVAWMREARADPANRRPCASCGGPTGYFRWSSHGTTELCWDCYAARREERWDKIEAWWAEGLTHKEILDLLGWKNSVNLSPELDAMRKAGRDVPRRPPGGLRRLQGKVRPKAA